MELLILVLLAVGIFAEENYDGPEYATKDHSMFMLPEESLGLWGRVDEPSYKPANDRHRRIVGGREAVPHSIPWQVFLHTNTLTRTIRYCGGTVITTNAVLTTLGCVERSLTTDVIAGAHNRLKIEPGQQRRQVPPENHRFHPETGQFHTRLAISIVPQPFTFNNLVKAVRLPTGFEHETFAGEKATISGWGRTGRGQPMSDVLRVVEVPVITNAECARAEGREVDKYSLCASIAHGTGTCFGDNGGPLTARRPGDMRPILIGVFAALATCAEEGVMPQRYFRVSSALPWIRANLS